MKLGHIAHRLRRLLPLTAALAVGAGAGAGAYALGHHSSGKTATSTVVVPVQPASSSSTVTSLSQLYKKDAPGVVDITVQLGSSGGGSSIFPFGSPPSQQQTEAEGTGFEIDKKGDILTAEHVVGSAKSIKVDFQDGSSAKATLVGKDKSTDTAVIHVNVPASQLHPLALGDSAAVQPGDSVVAIGSNLGLPGTMTAGIVSATNRTISSPSGYQITGGIQTDAAINHGNSGGPLIDTATNTVIGINDQIESDTSDNAGIAFAVPIDASKAVAQTLVAGHKVQHPFIGILIKPVPGGGARITQVIHGTPAAKAGLKVGDVVTALNGRSIENADALTTAVLDERPGQTVTLTIRRGSATKHVPVTLGVRPATPPS
jgi:putative serine protease PepD